MSSEDIKMVLLGISILNFLFAYLIFARLTAHPIEKKIKASGGELPEWDGIGLRIAAYGSALIFPVKLRRVQLVDEDALNRLATEADRWRARYVLGSLIVLLIVSVLI